MSMRLLIFIVVLFSTAYAWSWPFAQHSTDLQVNVLGEIAVDVPAKFVNMNEQQRKAEFVGWLLPIVERQNNIVEQHRNIILKIQKKQFLSISLTTEELDFINLMQVKYGGNSILDLLERVNTIPKSLVIAQASLESGWGSSRFAQEGNNLFGIRTYDKDVPGLTPLKNKNANFKVRSYATVDDGVANYLLLLNTHHAYNDFRIARAYMTHRFDVDAHALADTLLDYSELGSQYIEMVHKHLTNIERILNVIR